MLIQLDLVKQLLPKLKKVRISLKPSFCVLRVSGETTVTKTAEGVDQSEVTSLSPTRYGETSVTATVEGADRSEIVSEVDFDTDAPYSHF